MKRTALYVLVFLLILSPLSALAQDAISITLDGTAISFADDSKPFIQDGRTLIPLRAVSEKIGAVVNYIPENKTIFILKGDTSIVMQIGNDLLFVTKKDGTSNQVTLDVPANVYNDRTFVPIRFIAEAFGYDVSFDEATKTVNVKSK